MKFAKIFRVLSLAAVVALLAVAIPTHPAHAYDEDIIVAVFIKQDVPKSLKNAVGVAYHTGKRGDTST